MQVGAVGWRPRGHRPDEPVVFGNIVGVVGPEGAIWAGCACAVEVGAPVRADATETSRDERRAREGLGQGRGARGEVRGTHRRGHAERRGTSRRARSSSGRRRSTSAGRSSTWPRAGGTTPSLLARAAPATSGGGDLSARANRGAATPAVPPAVEMARVGEGGREADGIPRAHGKRHGQRHGPREGKGLLIDATAVRCPSALGGRPTPAACSSQAGSARAARTTRVPPSAA